MEKKKEMVSKFILLSVGIIIGLVIFEFGIRNNALIKKIEYIEQETKNIDKGDPGIGAFDKELGWGYKPNSYGFKKSSDYEVSYSINSHGIRDKEISFEKPFGQFRVLCLGESTVFGQGVNYGKRFTEVLEDSLADVEAVNMGVWGFGPDQSLLQLERDGLPFKPDLVVLFVIQDFFERSKFCVRLGEFKPRFVLADNQEDIVLQDLDFIKKNAVRRDFLSAQERDIKEKQKGFESIFSKSSIGKLLSYKKRMADAKSLLEEKEKIYWNSIEERLKEDSKQAFMDERSYQRLIFLLLKRYQQISNKFSAKFLFVYIDPDKGYFLKYFDAPCKELGIPCLDLSGVLDAASKKNKIRFDTDPHYNEFTHEIIGEYVSDYLAAQYYLQKKKVYTAVVQ